jgi:NAD+ synthase (glutamine-hydrolysing)
LGIKLEDVKIALAQINPTVGDFTGNLEKIVAASRRAAALGARLTVFSELAICGYPPADFLEKPSFLAAAARPSMSWPRPHASCRPRAGGRGAAGGGDSGKPAVNAAVLLDGGRLLLEQHKRLLPFYDVFDEQRYFAPSRPQQVVELDGVRLAITICEDAWNDKNFWPRRLYTVDPMEELMRQHPSRAHQPLLVALLAREARHSPRDAGGHRAARRRAGADVQPGGRQRQPDLRRLLAGPQCARRADRPGRLVRGGPGYRLDPFRCAGRLPAPEEDDTEAAYRALVLGTRDYVRKCGFRKALVGLSGGIDSALVAAIAKDALGAENVIGVGMPSPYSSRAPSTTAGSWPPTSAFGLR